MIIYFVGISSLSYLVHCLVVVYFHHVFFLLSLRFSVLFLYSFCFFVFFICWPAYCFAGLLPTAVHSDFKSLSPLNVQNIDQNRILSIHSPNSCFKD